MSQILMSCKKGGTQKAPPFSINIITPYWATGPAVFSNLPISSLYMKDIA